MADERVAVASGSSQAASSKKVAPFVAVAALAIVGVVVWRLFFVPSTPSSVVELTGRVEGDDSAVAAKVAGRILEVRVRDLGPGVPLQWREKIFDQYLQLESDERFDDRTSLGLGLAFCRLATQVHGGQIWVEDNQPRGSSFCIRLPVAGPPGAVPVEPPRWRR